MSKGRNHAATQNRRRRTVLIEEARHSIARRDDPIRGYWWAPSVTETLVLLVAADRLDTTGRG